jgi:transposase
LTTAAEGGLEPVPADRFRGADPHRLSSYALLSLAAFRARGARLPTIQELQLIDQQMSQLDHELASLLSRHQDAVEYLAEVPGLGVDSAQQITAEVGAKAVTLPSAKQLCSWVGASPGDEQSAGVSKNHRSPKRNRHMRRILNQAANAARPSRKEPLSKLSIAD